MTIIARLGRRYQVVNNAPSAWRGLSTMRKIAGADPLPVMTSAPVSQALREGKPIVALESTIISHGMPFPRNLEVAKSVEDVVRKHGAVPATCAVIRGVPKVGLSEEELYLLAREKGVIKASRRDLPYAIAQQLNAATTVAATMILADRAGVKVFATGGIGGVHRGAEISMDVSSDLYELAKTPVTVVCAGVKSILDIEKTLEVLETLGVPVIGYGTEEFPAFFVNNSGFKAPFHVTQTSKIAEMMKSARDLNLKNGFVVGVPNPVPFGDRNQIENAIVAALKESEKKNIKGAQITPFLLAAVEKLTDGSSLEANIALVLNNAKVAAEISCNYSRLVGGNSYVDYSISSNNITPQSRQSSTYSPNSSVLVIGGAAIDIIGTSSSRISMKTSNPGILTQSYGGVGRNISEALARRSVSVGLVSAVADDDRGKAIISHSQSIGIDTGCLKIVPKSQFNGGTATYSAIHDSNGDLSVSLADMSILTHVDSNLINSLEGKIEACRVVVVDGNITPEAFTALVRTVNNVKLRKEQQQRATSSIGTNASQSTPLLFFEPTSDFKCHLPIVTKTLASIDFTKPNIFELQAMVRACLTHGAFTTKIGSESMESITASLTFLGNCQSIDDLPNDTLLDHVRRLAVSLQQAMLGDSTSTPSSGSQSTLSTSSTTSPILKPKRTVLVSLGSRGVFWVGHPNDFGDDHDKTLFQYVRVDDNTSYAIIPAAAIDESEVVNANGAGDAFCAGLIHSILLRNAAVDATSVLAGHAAAKTKIMGK